MPRLLGLTREELARQFGEPTYTPSLSGVGEYLGFRNGIMVLMEAGKTHAYGVYGPP